ncbi:DUF222 domain-containing protein [Ornithinimicrobium sp. LYQ92]|uniref:HNH endonuclease signature motif containing protein n=1 Tax=Serinicoccus sp. LYQ92 TaxID=3378798 RepID=UPI003852D997
MDEGVAVQGPPGEGAVAVLGMLRAALDRSVTALSAPALLQEGELGDVLGALDAVTSRSHALMVAVLREAIARGLHGESGFSEVDWLRLVCPAVSSREAAEIACLARAGQEQVHGPLLEAVRSGALPVGRAAAVVRALGRVRTAIGPTEYARAAELMTMAATDARLGEADLARVGAQLVATCLSEGEQVARDRAREQLRDVHESSLADGSVRRVVITFGQDADYAAFRAVMMSPLAAPATLEETRATGQVETRTPGQRRYDALMAVLRRGVAGSTGQPTTPKAQLMVTIPLGVLTGQDPGCGVSGSGGPGGAGGPALSAHRARQLACEADLIPAVLGTRSEILDLGRAARLVTPGQRRALAHRDQGCTFPGCYVPASWCDAHHIVHWSRGGRSDLANYALLCARHHTWVHQHESTATTDVTGVTWHLR